ncbi:hypothetical protein RvY_09853 [Ramazzottius varieornatus]|uniref:HTH CENPB-type domain-containing protein n=1 Tax=Ramazzottius varieornatus TaxID=947166 RepID=A0A1D1VD56_RAMVA|nr:hypothetical protein RvY_09853 [Ramazzottius varieornatus]
MESVNPLNILRLLEVDYEQRYQPTASPSESDKLLRLIIKEFLDNHIVQFHAPAFNVEEDLEYERQLDVSTFEELEESVANGNLLNGHDEADFESVQDDRLYEPVSSATEPSSHELFIPRIPDPKVAASQAASLDYNKRAVSYWRSTKRKRRGLTSVQKAFSKVTSARELSEWERQVREGGSRPDKLKALRLETGKQFFLAKKKPHVVKDMDIRRWAVTANREIDLEGFTASPYWVGKFKQYYGICDRKITKFVTAMYLREAPDVKKDADECVACVQSRIQAYGLDCLWNADQSGFEYEIRPGRPLDFIGAKHVLALTQSENSMTHSYTVIMAVSPGNRKFLPVLFITLQEDKGVFGPIVSKALFKARNLHVTASKSGKMTKELYIEWCEKVFFPQMNGHCFFLADSWKTFADHDAVEEVKPEELEYEMITIPPKDSTRYANSFLVRREDSPLPFYGIKLAVGRGGLP